MKFTQMAFQSCITWPKNGYVDNLEVFSANVLGSKMYSKIDFLPSLCTIRKGKKNGSKHAWNPVARTKMNNSNEDALWVFAHYSDLVWMS